ncbi:hypothetical protein GCM10022254_60320 [Actinomadura meridiana]|uniref:DUF4232 domain-containing protein n=2 Tax=Actinomadura meridiana TaxID=559626 RepID=A0ABP8CIX6_9ACTN
MAAEMQEQDGSTETRTVSMLSLKNNSGRPCTIPAGWASMGLSDENGTYQPLQASRQNYPGAGMNITVKPGEWVYASMKWTTDVECPDTKSFAVSWYGTWVAAPAKWFNGPRQLCPNTVVQGTIQPTRVGVNFM